MFLCLLVIALMLALELDGFPSPPQNASSIRLVYSLTTNPERVFGLQQTIDSLLKQEREMPDLIQVNIPWVYLRTNESFHDLDKIEILKHPLVKVHRCRDYGPITKLMGTLESEKDPNTLIVVVDDDYKYPFYLTYMMRATAAAEPDHAVVGHCGDTLLINAESDFWQPPFNQYRTNDKRSACCCRMMEGFGAVGYRAGFFHNATSKNANFTSFDRYLEVALAHKKCFRADDLVISNYLALQGIQGILINTKVWPTKQNYDHYALSKQVYHGVNGQVEVGHPYYNCSRFLKSHGIGSVLKPIVPDQERENITCTDGSLLQCANDRTVYLIQNQTRRPFASGGAFMGMGFDFGQIRKIVPRDCPEELYWYSEGQPIT